MRGVAAGAEPIVSGDAMGKPYGAGVGVDGSDAGGEPLGRRGGDAPSHGRARGHAGLIALLVAAIATAVALVTVLRLGGGEELVLLESTDYAAQPDAVAGSTERWTAEVVDGALRIRALHAGAVQLPWVETEPTHAAAIAGAFEWPDGSAGDELYVGGLMLLGADGAGWGLACGTDGRAYLLAVWPGRSQALDAVAGAGCDEGAFTLSLRAEGSDVTDTLSAELPDGRDLTFKPGGTHGPFVQAGFLVASEDRTLTVPGLDVEGFQVRGAG